MLPLPLGSTAHDEEVAGGEHHLVGPTAVHRAQMKRSRTTQADDRDEWVRGGSSDAIGMPGNAVLTTGVVVTKQPHERPLVVSAECIADVIDDGRKLVSLT